VSVRSSVINYKLSSLLMFNCNFLLYCDVIFCNYLSTCLLITYMNPGCVVKCKLCRSCYLTHKFFIGADYYVLESSVVVGIAGTS
jgi:hypothetical protein